MKNNFCDNDDDDGKPFFQGFRDLQTTASDTMSVLAQICLDAVPGGKFYLGEYMGSHSDHKDQENSLCINLQTGRWTDIASNVQGFDPLTYYAHVTGLSFEDAFGALNKELDKLFGCATPTLM